MEGKKKVRKIVKRKESDISRLKMRSKEEMRKMY